MNFEELFVGSLAIALGAFTLGAAVFNWDWYYQLRKASWVEGRLGRIGARLLFAAIGLALIAMGIAITMGYGPNKSNAASRERNRIENATAYRC